MKMKRKNAKLVCFFLSLLLAMGIPISALAAWENLFTDVKSGDWFYDAVYDLVQEQCNNVLERHGHELG